MRFTNQQILSYITSQIELVQLNGALAIKDATRGTSKDKLHQELGLESLKDRR